MHRKTNDPGWSALLSMIAVQRVRLFSALALTAMAAACELLPYWVIFQAVDALLQQQPDLDSTLYQLAGWMAAALLLKTLFYSLAYFFSHQAAFSILAATRKTLVAHLAGAPLNWLQQRSSGQLKQSVLQDVENIEMVISHHTVEIFAALVSPLLVTAYLLWIDWRLALAALVTAPLAVLASTLFMRDTSEQYDQFSKAAAQLNGATVEYLRNMPVMKVFRQGASNFQVMRQRLENYYGLISKLTKKTVPGWALFSSLLGANVLFILPLGIWLHAESAVTLSQVVMVVILGSGMLKPLLKVSRFYMEFNEVLAGVRRLQPILDLRSDQRDNTRAVCAPVTVEFQRVSFHYGAQSTLETIDLTLPPGSFTVLLGPSGAGKSTVAQLLAGLLLPDSGSVMVNDLSVADLGNAERASLIALASQDAFLFKGTIMDNLRLARPTASDQEVVAAVRTAQAEALIDSLPLGYDTIVHEQGVRLSGGERQRIAVARALLAATPILVLDEATASLDNRTQQAFYRDLKAQYADKTILVITHRSYGIENTDQILVLNQGQIQAAGKHRELLSDNHYYRQLWQRQTESENWSIGAGKDQLQEAADV